MGWWVGDRSMSRSLRSLKQVNTSTTDAGTLGCARGRRAGSVSAKLILGFLGLLGSSVEAAAVLTRVKVVILGRRCLLKAQDLLAVGRRERAGEGRRRCGYSNVPQLTTPLDPFTRFSEGGWLFPPSSTRSFTTSMTCAPILSSSLCGTLATHVVVVVVVGGVW